MWYRTAPHELVLGRVGPYSFFPTIRLSSHERTGHTYIVGKTGKGKSKLLAHFLYQDIIAGRACGVIDPHSDLVSDVLALLHKSGELDRQQERIMYLNPADSRYIVPFNVLATPGDPYEVAQMVIESFRRAWPESLSSAPHFANIMLHALLVLIHAKLTLVDLPQLLTKRDIRRSLLASVNIPELTEYFEERFEAWSAKDPRLLESSLNKVTALTLNPHIKRMIGQRENRLDFASIMREKVLLCDLGHCGEESQRLIANLINCSIEQAAFARDSLPHSERIPFYWYIDEFQDFVSDGADRGGVKTLSKILSGARKYGLHLTLANQNLSQLSERMIGAIIGNVWTKVIMGCSEQDAFVFARYLGLGNIDPTAIKHQAQTDTQHPMYYPLSEQENHLAAMLANQKPRQAIVRTHEGKTKQMWSVTLDTNVPDHVLQQFRLASLMRHGNPLAEVEANLGRLFEQISPEIVPAVEISEAV